MRRVFTVIIKGEEGRTKKTIDSIEAQKLPEKAIQIIVLENGEKISPRKIKGKWVNIVQAGQSWSDESFDAALKLISQYGENAGFLLADDNQDLSDEVRVASSALQWYQNNPGKYIISRRHLSEIVDIANADTVEGWKKGITRLFLTNDLAILSRQMHLQRKYKYDITDEYLKEGLPRTKRELYQGVACAASSLPGQVAWMIQIADVLKSNVDIERIKDWLTAQLKELDDYAVYNGAFSGALRRRAFEIKYGRDVIIQNLTNVDGALYFHNLKMPNMHIEDSERKVGKDDIL